MSLRDEIKAGLTFEPLLRRRRQRKRLEKKDEYGDPAWEDAYQEYRTHHGFSKKMARKLTDDQKASHIRLEELMAKYNRNTPRPPQIKSRRYR